MPGSKTKSSNLQVPRFLEANIQRYDFVDRQRIGCSTHDFSSLPVIRPTTPAIKARAPPTSERDLTSQTGHVPPSSGANEDDPMHILHNTTAHHIHSIPRPARAITQSDPVRDLTDDPRSVPVIVTLLVVFRAGAAGRPAPE